MDKLNKTRKLEEGIDYNVQNQYRQQFKSIDKFNFQTSILNGVVKYENKYRTPLFMMSKKQLMDYLSSFKSVNYLDSTKSHLRNYYEYYKKYVNDSISDELFTVMTRKVLNDLIIKNKVKYYIKTPQDLISKLQLIRADKNELAFCLLLYMGFPRDEIRYLTNGNVNYNGTLLYDKKRYSKIPKEFIKILKSNIYNIDDHYESLIKNTSETSEVKNGGDTKYDRVLLGDNIMTSIRNKSKEYFLNDYLTSTTLNQAGALYYAYMSSNQNDPKFIYQILIWFNIIKTDDVQEQRINFATKEFNMKLQVIKIPSEDIIYKYNLEVSNLNQLDPLEDITTWETFNPKLYEEKKRDVHNSENDKYAENRKVGNINEHNVYNKLLKVADENSVKFMDDTVGYDIQFSLKGTLHRVEVKTIDSDKTFHISINELNAANIRVNYIIVVVYYDEVKVISEIVKSFNIIPEEIFKKAYNSKITMITTNYKISLSKSFYDSLLNLNDYLKSILEDG